MLVFVYAPVLPERRHAFEVAASDDERVGGVVEDETTGGLETYFEQARERLAHGHELHEGGEHALAVVVAQTACEVLIREVLPTLVQSHVTDDVFPWVLERIRQYTLNDRQTQDLWSRVAGSAIQEQDFWPAYYCLDRYRRSQCAGSRRYSSGWPERLLDGWGV